MPKPSSIPPSQLVQPVANPPSALPAPPPPAASPTPQPTVSTRKLPSPRRGEVYWVNIPKSHTVGHEQYKRRPFLIISNNAIHHLDIVIGVPLSFQTHKANRQYRIQVLANDIIMDAGSTLDPGDRIALTEQVRCLSVERLEPDRQATLTDTATYAVESGTAFVMDIR